MSTDNKIVNQLIALVARVEGLCENRRLIPPVEVTAIDPGGKLWRFSFSPEWDSVEVLLPPPRLPITLRLMDSNGIIVEERITELSLGPVSPEPASRQ